MYSYIKGTLEETDNDTIVVENNGIGYNISVSGRVLDELPDIGESVKIYTYLHGKGRLFCSLRIFNPGRSDAVSDDAEW